MIIEWNVISFERVFIHDEAQWRNQDFSEGEAIVTTQL